MKPMNDVACAYPLTKLGLLSNIAFRSGGTAHWDDQCEPIRDNNPRASALSAREYRGPWKLLRMS